MSVLAVASSTCNASSSDHRDGCAGPTYEANALFQPSQTLLDQLLTAVWSAHWFGDAVNVRGIEVIYELKTAVKYASVVAN